MAWRRIFGSNQSSSSAQSSQDGTVRSQDTSSSTQRRSSRGTQSELSSYRDRTSARESNSTYNDYGLSTHYRAYYGSNSERTPNTSYDSGHNRSNDSDELISRLSSLSVSSSSREVDYSSRRVEHDTITERGKSLSTTALDLCTGIAVGGVRRQSDGSVADSSVSVFHVLPSVRAPGVSIARKINDLRSAGYEVNAYVAGGDSTSDAGRKQRQAMESMLSGMEVPYGSGPLSDSRYSKYSRYLSASIQDDGQISYKSTTRY